MSLAVSARPWIGSSNRRTGRVLHSHLRSPRLGAPYSSGGTFGWIAKYFCPHLRGRVQAEPLAGDPVGSREDGREAPGLAPSRSRREFASSFRIRLHRSYIAHRPEDRVVLHELVRAPGCQRTSTALHSFEPRQAAERQPNRRSLLDGDGWRLAVPDFMRKCPKRVQ